MGKDAPDRDMFDTFADSCPCCGRHLMQDMQNDPLFASKLSDGCFDTKFPADLNLANILESFIPDFGVSRPALNGKAIRITIRMGAMPQVKTNQKFQKKLQEKQQENTKESQQQDKEQEAQKEEVKKTASLVGDQFRRTYARYVISFAQRNDEDTCRLAMQKLARYR